jgi:dipeptidyl aminopeptidase/acylaminoacyl peptidase
MARRLSLLALLTGVLVAVPGPHDGARAAVPGKNGRIAFVRSAGAGPLEEVFMANPNVAPGPAVNLTNDPPTSDTAPSWSPDGAWIAFTREGAGGTTSIMTLAAAGGGGELAVTAAGGFDGAPDWAPDGRRIAFARGGDQDDGLPLHIDTVTLATGTTTQVTTGPVQDLMPSWQPL